MAVWTAATALAAILATATVILEFHNRLFGPPVLTIVPEPLSGRPGTDVHFSLLVDGKPPIGRRCVWAIGNAALEQDPGCQGLIYRVPLRFLDPANDEAVLRATVTMPGGSEANGRASTEVPIQRAADLRLIFADSGPRLLLGERLPVALHLNGWAPAATLACTWDLPRDAGRVITAATGACSGLYEAPQQLPGGALSGEVRLAVQARLIGSPVSYGEEAILEITRPPGRYLAYVIDLSEPMRSPIDGRSLLDRIRDPIIGRGGTLAARGDFVSLTTFGGRVGNNRRRCEAAQLPIPMDTRGAAQRALSVVVPALAAEGREAPLFDAVERSLRDLTVKGRDASSDARRILLVVANGSPLCTAATPADVVSALTRSLREAGLAETAGTLAVLLVPALDPARQDFARALASAPAFAESGWHVLAPRSADGFERALDALSRLAVRDEPTDAGCAVLRREIGEFGAWSGAKDTFHRLAAFCPSR
ncbi:MAG: hypothetical protein EXQ85_02150 [Alphaproteobacteria bacterium]|nr:hypothetical protein [Alphaproteobacteria bacterium]